MRRIPIFPAAVSVLLALFCVLSVSAQGPEEIIWEQAFGGSSQVADFGPSQQAGSSSYTLDQTLADDINLVGTVNRIYVFGAGNGSSTIIQAPYYYGLRVTFYEFTPDGRPGAVQATYFVPKDSPNYLQTAFGLSQMAVRLEPAFQATGRHFVGVQAVMDPVVLPGSGGATVKWYWRSAVPDALRGERFWYRESPGSPWVREGLNDSSRNLAIRLWGTRILTTPPTISGLSSSTLPQAGRLKISGNFFGQTKGNSVVRINGAIAPVSRWSETSITAYVSDASTIGPGTVAVTTDGGTTSVPFTVTARSGPMGRVQWRFMADGGSFFGRPVVAPDGTIHAVDQQGHLYALEPDGGIKWIFTGKFPAYQNPDVSSDGTVYYEAGNELYAVRSDGTLKWKITNPDGGRVCAGPNLGPDGNIYAVFFNANSSGLSAVVVSPEGQILDNDPSYFEAVNDFGIREIVFGAPGQYYFVLNNLDQQRSGFNFFGLGGNWLFSRPQYYGQPAVAPSGTIYAVDASTEPDQLTAIDPTNGSVIRRFGVFMHPDIGSDSNIYAQNAFPAIAISFTPDGAERWRFSGFGILGKPIVSPDNHVVSLSDYEFSQPGVVYGLDATNGSLAWQVNLPAENGGYVRAMARARYSHDSQTVYYGTNVNDYANDVYTYLYAITASRSVPCSFGITPSSASFPHNGGTGSVEVVATNNNCPWTSTSNASWISILTSGSTGNGTVTYAVSANPDFTPRTGTITIAGQTFTITQAPRTTTTSVTITTPANGSSFPTPSSIFVGANATNSNGTVARVEFFANAQSIGVDTSAPYLIAWNNPAATTYTLIARAFDAAGVATESEPVTITVNPAPGPEPAPLPIPPPTLNSPQANQEYLEGESINFAATPGPSQYPVARVEFYLNTTLIGSDTSAPYTFSIPAPAKGQYSASARTVAGTGARANSQPVDIRVVSTRILGTNPFDFDGDGKADASIFRPSNGQWWLARSTAGNVAYQFGSGTDKLVPADFTGDGKADVAFWRGTTGEWFVLRSEDSTFYAFPFGANEDIPVQADYDGDRKADAAVFRPSAATWYVQKSSGGTMIRTFGQLSDRPVVSDYDGDGKADIAIYRPEVGEWWINRSSNNSTYAMQFGSGADRVVPADYTGDGKADIAVFRGTSGEWMILRSEDSSYYSFPFGVYSDVAVPADYDGDGRADAAVYREGVWHIQRSSSGYTAFQFGIASDTPVPTRQF